MKADVERGVKCLGKTTDIGIVFIHDINKKGNNVLIYCNGVRKYLE